MKKEETGSCPHHQRVEEKLVYVISLDGETQIREIQACPAVCWGYVPDSPLDN